ncbi:hypothetical protein MRX96_048726 [Rhipicephalus microplus]
MALNAATDQQYHLLDQDGTAGDQMDQLQGDHDTDAHQTLTWGTAGSCTDAGDARVGASSSYGSQRGDRPTIPPPRPGWYSKRPNGSTPGRPRYVSIFGDGQTHVEGVESPGSPRPVNTTAMPAHSADEEVQQTEPSCSNPAG